MATGKDDFEIRDSIHDMIGFGPEEVSLIDTKPMQRLRFVKQLAFTYLVYPSALHTRFEHSLGTCHLAGQMAKRIELSAEEVKAIRCAALLHDIGHAPFSHVGEEVVKLNSLEAPKDAHEKISIMVIENSDEIRKILDGENGAGVENVKALLEHKEPSFGSSIICGQVDADKMDYLLRDSYHTGVTYGTIDRPRILSTIRKAENEKRIAFKEDGVYAIEQLILARHHMGAQVYTHKTRVVADAMAIRGICLAIRSGVVNKNLFDLATIPANIDRFLGFDDETLTHIVSSGEEGYAKDLFSRLRERRLLPTVAKIPIDQSNIPDDNIRFRLSGLKPQELEKIEERFANEMGFPKELTIVNVQTLKSPTIPAPGGKIDIEGILILDEDDRVKGFSDCAHSLRVKSGEQSTSSGSVDELRSEKEDLFAYAPAENWKDKGNRPKTTEKAKEVLLGILGDLV